MTTGEVSFEKLIGVNLSEHVTDMRCLKRGAAGFRPQGLFNQMTRNPIATYHLLCLPKMPRVKPNSTHSRNLIKFRPPLPQVQL